MEAHLRWFGESDSSGLLFVGPKGGKLRRSNFHHIRAKALANAGVLPARFHDLRHMGNTMATDIRASTRELMHRIGHSTMDAALRYQYMRRERDRLIADAMDAEIKKAQGAEASAEARSPGGFWCATGAAVIR